MNYDSFRKELSNLKVKYKETDVVKKDGNIVDAKMEILMKKLNDKNYAFEIKRINIKSSIKWHCQIKEEITEGKVRSTGIQDLESIFVAIEGIKGGYMDLSRPLWDQIVEKKEKNEIRGEIDEIFKDFDINWDNVMTNGSALMVYGWLKKDFVVVQYDRNTKKISGASSSEAINDYLYEKTGLRQTWIKYKDYFQ